MQKYITLILALCLFSLPVQAVQQRDFYSASVPVPSRDKSAFQQGLRDALVLVLAKVSGQSADAVREVRSLAGELDRGDRYASQFSYATRTIVGNDGAEQEQLFLKASFPGKIVDNLLRMGNLRFWPNDRPELLVWVVMNRGGEIEVADMAKDTDALLLAEIKQAASNHGLPLKIAEAGSGVDVQKLWRWSESGVARASRAYGNEQVLVSRLGLTSEGMVLGGWLLLDGNKVNKLDLNIVSPTAFVDEGVTWAARTLAARYSVTLSLADSELVASVEGVNSEDNFLELIDFLESLDVVDEVFVLHVKDDTLRLVIKLKSEVSQFDKLLDQQSRLEKISDNNIQMELRWNEGSEE